jgi:uncharacterized protein (DUF362 family)/Pyruvate/2-oxoacid:ferredoxin oxidoreductase delta subunit
VYEAVGRGLALLGGVGRFVHPGEKILLKPNLLIGSAPEAAVTTHPAVLKAVSRYLASVGARLSCGDAPAIERLAGAARRAGLADVAAQMDMPLVPFSQGQTVSFADGGLIKQFIIASSVLEADGIVSLPKFKTHGLTRMTGAIKNQFGCIPGVLKSEFHVRLPTADLFSQMLVDLNRLLRPRLYVMDGIVAMEGNGPRGGDPRPMSVLLLSDDPAALDATACRMMNLDPALVPTLPWAERWGLGRYQDINILGDPLDTFITPDFVVNRRRGSTTGGQGALASLVKNLVVPRPAIDPHRCTRCGTCVRICPVDPKAVDFRDKDQPPVHYYDRCIRCYCCQETCPEHAITIHTPLLGRLIHR